MTAIRRWPIALALALVMVSGAACGASPNANSISRQWFPTISAR